MIRHDVGENGNIERGGEISEIQFSIEADAAAFEALSADLYTNRIQAPIRELSANAADAHVDANNVDTPFVIHAPCRLAPHFSIRDFGTGLSRQQIETLYTRYFKSTKTHSNNFIGCKGLGSKSPFAYVDSFNVVSYHGGKKMVFNCFKNEQRCPAVAFLGEEDTTEHNGLEVSFSVKGEDIWKFEKEIKSSLKFFKHQPTVKGIFYSHEPTEYMIQTEEFGIVGNSSSSLVVMGNIAYPFDNDPFINTDDALTTQERRLVDWGVHLFVEIGDVEVAISREKLTYTKNTRTTLKRLLSKAVAATQQEAENIINEAKNIWDARIAIANVRKGVLSEITQFSDFQWNNKSIDEYVRLEEYPNKPKTVEFLSRDKNSYYRRRRSSSHNYFDHSVCDKFSVADLPIIFINDMEHGGYAAARRHMEDESIKKAIMFSSDVTQEFIDEICCGGLIKKCSDIPKPERQKRDRTTRSDKTILQLVKDGILQNVEKDLSEGGVYIEVRRDKIKWKNKDYWNPSDYSYPGAISGIVECMKKLGFDQEIYGIRRSDLHRLNKHKNWITFEEAFHQIQEKNEHLVEELNRQLSADLIPHVQQCVLNLESNLDDGCPVKEMINIVNKSKCEISEEAEAFDKLRELEISNHYPTAPDHAPANRVKEIMRRYPLLDALEWRWYNSSASVEDIVSYIEFIDSKVALESLETNQQEDAA